MNRQALLDAEYFEKELYWLSFVACKKLGEFYELGEAWFRMHFNFRLPVGMNSHPQFRISLTQVVFAKSTNKTIVIGAAPVILLDGIVMKLNYSAVSLLRAHGVEF